MSPNTSFVPCFVDFLVVQKLYYIYFGWTGQIATVIEGFKRKDLLFVETSAYRELRNIVDDRHWALILGRPGDGKSSMAAHLILEYTDKGFEPIIVINLSDWKAVVDGDRTKKQIVMIDDMFGSMNVDHMKVNEWLSAIEVMEKLVKEKKGNLLVVCTSRKYVFMDVNSKFSKYTFCEDISIVDFTFETYSLTIVEKQNIWLKYALANKIATNMPACIKENINSPHGLPHCVELYCSNTFLREQGDAFFRNPMKYVCREIKNFMEHDKIKYCLLLLVLFNNNKLNNMLLQQICLSNPPNHVLKIFKAAGLSTDIAQAELRRALYSLNGTYVIEAEEGVYSFSHDSLKENVAFIYLKNNTLDAINEVDFKVWADYTMVYNGKQISQENIFVIPSFCVQAFVERVVKELNEGDIMTVLKHQAWDEQTFLESFTVFTTEHNLMENLLITERKVVIQVKLFVNEFVLKNLTFLEALLYCRKEKAANYLLNDDVILGLIRSGKFKSTLSHALVCACINSTSCDVVLKLIKAGADVNVTVSDNKMHDYSDYVHGSLILSTILDLKQFTPLLTTICNGNSALANMLLNHGASIFIDGKPSVIYLAMLLYVPEIVCAIIKRVTNWRLGEEELNPILPDWIVDNEIRDRTNVWNYDFSLNMLHIKTICTFSAIHIVRDTSTLKLLINEGVNVNKDVITPFGRLSHCIFRLANFVTEGYVIRNLLQAGMKVKGHLKGKNCLHFLFERFKHWEIIEQIPNSLWPYKCEFSEVTCEFIEEFISKFALYSPIDSTDKNGRSPLHYFFLLWEKDSLYDTEVGLASFMQLLKYDADVNLKDTTGMTPAMAALKHCEDSEIILVCLKKSSPKLTDNYGKGYFHYLAESQLSDSELTEVMNQLLDTEDDINLKDNEGNTPVFYCNISQVKIFLNSGAILDTVNNAGQNMLHYILKEIDVTKTEEFVQKISKFAGKLKLADESGQTFIHYLMMSKLTEIDSFKRMYGVLLSMGCSPRTANAKGITPLMLAVENSSFNCQIIEFLLEQGSLTCTDTCGLSVLHHCIAGSADENTKTKFIRVLIQQSNDLITLGCNVLWFALSKTTCSLGVILELLNYKRYETKSDLELMFGLLLSSRCLEEKISYLMTLVNQGKVSVTYSEILVSKAMKSSIRLTLTKELIKHNLITPEHMLLMIKDVSQIFSKLDEKSTFRMLQQMSLHHDLEIFLTDCNLITTLCKQNYIMSLLFIIKHDLHVVTQQYMTGNSLLHTVVDLINNDTDSLDIVTTLIENNADLYQCNNESLTPLHLICGKSNLKPQTTSILISSMSNVDQSDDQGMTALQYLCSHKIDEANRDTETDILLYLAFCLICKGADVDHKNKKAETCFGLAILSQPWNINLLSFLISNSRNTNVKDGNGITLLHHIFEAPIEDEPKAFLLDLLLENGGDLNIKNEYGQSCVCIAQKLIANKCMGLSVFEFLNSHGYLEHVTINEIFEILFANIENMYEASSQSVQVVRKCIQEKKIDINTRNEFDSRTLIMAACENMKPETVKMLLSLKADPNIRDMIGYTCLIRLLTSLHLAHMSVIEASCIGIDISAQSQLHVFSFLWNPSETQDFIDFVDNSEMVVNVGDTDFYSIASFKRKQHLDILAVLLSSGADPNMTDISGQSALHHYVQSPVSDSFICPAMRMLIKHGADIDAVDIEGMTPLMACSRYPGRKCKRMRILLEAGANILAMDHFGCDSIEYAKQGFAIMLQIGENEILNM